MAYEQELIPPNSAEPEVAVNAEFAKVAAALADIDTGGGLPEGGTPGQILYVGEDGLEWGDLPVPEEGSGVPPGGTAGQVLTKNSGVDGDASWQTPATGGDGGGGDGGASSIRVVRVKRNTSYAPPTNDWNNIQYQAVAMAEIDGVWSAAEPERFYAPPGARRIRFTAFQAFDTNNGNAYIHLVDKNNQNIGASRPGIPVQSLWYGKADGGGGQLVSRWIDVVPGDWFSIKWFYLSGPISAGSGAQADAFVQVECDTSVPGAGTALGTIGPRTVLRRNAQQNFDGSWSLIAWDAKEKDALNTYAVGGDSLVTVPAGFTAAKLNIQTVHINQGGNRLLRYEVNGVVKGVATPDCSNEGGITLETRWLSCKPGDKIGIWMVNSAALADASGFGGGTVMEILWGIE